MNTDTTFDNEHLDSSSMNDNAYNIYGYLEDANQEDVSRVVSLAIRYDCTLFHQNALTKL